MELQPAQTRSVVMVPPMASEKMCSRLDGRSLEQKIQRIEIVYIKAAEI
jgi:hypothetical protein